MNADQRARRGRRWPWLLGGLFAVAGLSNGLLVIKAATDPSFAVVPDYYERSLVWDQKLSQDQENARLGWKVDLQLTRVGQEVELSARLQDRDGAALRGARVELQALHKARASSVLTAELAEQRAPGGVYGARLPMRRPGLWELALAVSQGQRRFTALLVQELDPPEAPSPSGAGSPHAEHALPGGRR